MPRVIGGRYGLSSKEFTPRWRWRSSTNSRSPSPKRHFTVGIADDVTHTSLDVDHLHDRARRRRAGRLLRPGQRRHRGREQELGQDHRRGHAALRSGLLRLRLEEVGLDHRLAPPVRPAPDPLHVSHRAGADFVACHQFGFLDRIDVLDVAGAGAHFPAEQPVRPGRGVGPPAGRGPAADRRQGALRSSSSTRTRWRTRPGSAGG